MNAQEVEGGSGGGPILALEGGGGIEHRSTGGQCVCRGLLILSSLGGEYKKQKLDKHAMGLISWTRLVTVRFSLLEAKASLWFTPVC